MTRYMVICCALLALSAVAQQPDATFAARFSQARAAWQSAGFTRYVYGYNKFCECHAQTPPETLVSVDNGTVTDVRHRMHKTGDIVPARAGSADLYWTVDDLFALIERALDDAATVRATFDAESGVPANIFIDYWPDLTGDEVDVRITSFDAR